MIYDRPIRELLVEAVAAMPRTFRRHEVVVWFMGHYPLVNPNSVTAHITAATVNSRSRHHYPGADQHLIFKRSDGLLELYDASRHGKWDLHGEIIPNTTVDPLAKRLPPQSSGTVRPASSPDGERRVRIPTVEPDVRERDQVGRALEILAADLAPFVDQRMCAARGSNWYDSFSSRAYGSSFERAQMDPRFLLKVMTEAWDAAFSPPLSRMERTLVFELRETGNRWAHHEPFTWDDVDRTLDSVERLLHPFDPEAAAKIRRSKFALRRTRGAEEGQLRPDGAPIDSNQVAAGSTTDGGSRVADVPDVEREGRLTNWRLILAAVNALIVSGRTPFTRVDVYEWIWERYPRSQHERGALDPIFQGMVRNARGGVRSACGEPLERVDRGCFVLVDAVNVDAVGTRQAQVQRGHPGHPISTAELLGAGFEPLDLRVDTLDVELPSGLGCEWTTLGEIPVGPGLYSFTVEENRQVSVAYVGRTDHLWMVIKGRLPNGDARGGQRYGRPRHAGTTRQRINVLVAEQIRLGRVVRHWVRPLPATVLRTEEERLITEWDLRRIGWNRG